MLTGSPYGNGFSDESECCIVVNMNAMHEVLSLLTSKMTV
jgi:hypothetical protein